MENSFDSLAKLLGGAATRREALKRLGQFGGAAVLSLFGLGRLAPAATLCQMSCANICQGNKRCGCADCVNRCAAGCPTTAKMCYAGGNTCTCCPGQTICLRQVTLQACQMRLPVGCEGNSGCACTYTTDNPPQPFCWCARTCNTQTPCTTSNDCPSGQKCVQSCCLYGLSTNVCLPPCSSGCLSAPVREKGTSPIRISPRP